MKRCLLLYAMILLLLTGCQTAPLPGEDTLPETTAAAARTEPEAAPESVYESVSFANLLAEIDPDSIVSIRIGSGGLGTSVTVKDSGEIAAILAAAEPLTGTEPIPSQGFYGADFVVQIFYREDDIPTEFSFEIWSNGPKPQKDAAVILRMVDGNAFFAETLSDGQTVRIDSPMYTVDADALTALNDLCKSYFPAN